MTGGRFQIKFHMKIMTYKPANTLLNKASLAYECGHKKLWKMEALLLRVLTWGFLGRVSLLLGEKYSSYWRLHLFIQRAGTRLDFPGFCCCQRHVLRTLILEWCEQIVPVWKLRGAIYSDATSSWVRAVCSISHYLLTFTISPDASRVAFAFALFMFIYSICIIIQRERINNISSKFPELFPKLSVRGEKK
jgi:hypothetical protein